MLLVPNHHVIVPNTLDLAATVSSISYDNSDRIYIELYGDSIMCGRDADLADSECGCNDKNIQARVPQPPARLIEIFLPQYKFVISTRSSGLSTSADLLTGNDGVNAAWPDNQEANVVVVNHGLNDARYEVPVQTYENNLRSLRDKLSPDKVMVWQTPTVARGINTSAYAAAMKRVAADYNDIVADAHNITRWLGELPDGIHPRQLGYAELVDLCLASAINQAIIKHRGPPKETPHKFLRGDYQEKHVLENNNWVQLGFTPRSQSWVEVYYRDNVSFRAVSRGLLDTKGILTAGVYNGDTNEKLVSTGRSYNLVKIKRDQGRIIFNKNYDVYGSVNQANLLADELNETTNDYIIVITTFDEPKTNRLTQRLKDALYRCGASEGIFGSANFKYRSSYILVGIPGCGMGHGLESYNGLVDGTETAIANAVTLIGGLESNVNLAPVGDRLYYSTTSTAPNWTSILNTYGVWEKELSADLIELPRTIDANLIGDDDTGTIKSDGLLNIGGVKPIARWMVMAHGAVQEIRNGYINTESTNLVIGETPDCALAGMQFGIQGISYVTSASTPVLQLTADVLKPFTIEAVIWPLQGGGGGMIINKDSEYEIALDGNGNVMVALDWGVGSDVSLPGGGWYYTNVNIPWNTRSHLAWVVDGTTFYIYVNGVLKFSQAGLDRVSSPSSSPVVIGNRPGQGQQFTGYIMDVRIWDKGYNGIDFNVVKNYLEITDVPFRVGVAPLLEYFVPTHGPRPTDDLVIIGSAVTDYELKTYGIYSTLVDLLRGEPGTEVNWQATFTAERNIKIGYWLWDIRKYPSLNPPNMLYENTYTSRQTDTASGTFVIPPHFTSKSIIVFGVGDWDPQPPTGLSNVTMAVTSIGSQIDWSGNYYKWQVFFPVRGEYTFSLSADNRAYLDIVLDRTNASFERVVSALDVCKGYDEVATAVYSIPKCGWYNIRIYAENTGDVSTTPQYYAVPTALGSYWSTLLSNFGVVNGSGNLLWAVYLDKGDYAFEFSADSSGILKISGGDYPIDGTPVVSTLYFDGDPGNAIEVFTNDWSILKSGWYNIRILASFVGTDPQAVAARIKDSSGLTIWSTRSKINPDNSDNKGVAAKVTNASGTVIWNTRHATNQRDFNDFTSRRIFDFRSTYSEIEFEIAANGTPFPIDIYPTRPEYMAEAGNVTLMKANVSYDVVSNVPPVNGTRMINAKYNMQDAVGAPDTFRISNTNKLIFTRPLTGVVTVVCDTTDMYPRNSLQIDFTNIQNLDRYRQRFHPARYAPGYDIAANATSTFGLAAYGALANSDQSPRQANTVTMTTGVLKSANVYNSGLDKLVGDSHFAEPVVLAQPQHGFARISSDRTSIIYTPFPNYVGPDSLSYTLLSQHGQAGLPKSIYVEVFGAVTPPVPPPPPALSVSPKNVSVGESTHVYFEWIIVSGADKGKKVKFDVEGTASANIDYVFLIQYASLVDASSGNFQPYTLRSYVTLVEPSYVVRIGPILDDPFSEPEETMILTVTSTNGSTVRSTIRLHD